MNAGKYNVRNWKEEKTPPVSVFCESLSFSIPEREALPGTKPFVGKLR